jgi:hypothetical protein
MTSRSQAAIKGSKEKACSKTKFYGVIILGKILYYFLRSRKRLSAGFKAT